MIIREIKESEKDEAMSLVRKVFMEFVAPEYDEKGIQTFCAFIEDEKGIADLTIYGAFEEEIIIGVAATREAGSHISLLFVDDGSQMQGIGKKLFQTIVNKCTAHEITANSSPFALDFYHSIGFCDKSGECLKDGIRYTPMVYTKA